MARPEPRQLDVIAKRQVTPNMLRITLGGPGLADFPADQTSAYIKLRLPDQAAGREVVRTYTVRSHRSDEIDVDFALHEECGPATLWAMNTEAGDSIMAGGPGPRKLVHPDSDWYLLVGDMTALPAISGNLELLPDTARGTAVIEVMDEADIQKLRKPPHLNIEWVINPRPGRDSAPLVERVRSVAWAPGAASVWAACEFTSMRQLRDYFPNERGLNRGNLYISSYWKAGLTEDNHKIAKREDAIAADGSTAEPFGARSSGQAPGLAHKCRDLNAMYRYPIAQRQ